MGRIGLFQSALFISSMLNLFFTKDSTADYKTHLNTSLLMKLKDSSLEFSVETGNNSDELINKFIGNHNLSESRTKRKLKTTNTVDRNKIQSSDSLIRSSIKH
jgi:hypothetical protein